MTDWPDQRFLDLTGAEVPIVQAPMAGASGVTLAVAAMRGGAVGSLPCAMLTPIQVIVQAAEVRADADGPLNLNFFCHPLGPAPDDTAWREALAPLYVAEGVEPGPPPPLRRPFDAAMAEAVEAVQPDIVSFHFGLPDAALLARVRAAGALVFGNATTSKEMRWLADAGVDAIIVQGAQAGGHAGWFLDRHHPTSLDDLLGVNVPVPKIAAGGIVDAADIVAALSAGASAVQIGTAYLASPESEASAPHRALLGTATETVFTNLFSGREARGLRNRLIDAIGPINALAPPFPHASAALTPLRAKAEADGRGDYSPLWAGTGAARVRPEPAEALTRRLAAENPCLAGDRLMPLEIVRIPAFSDNYIWLVHDPDSRETMVVDPGEATAVLAEAARRGWTISAIWNTHWHPDHTGGNQAIKDATGAPVIAPAAEAAKIPTADRLVAEGDTVTLGRHVATVLETPAHTAGHITYHFADDAALFPGDTLFAMGCGRLFEGTAAQMHANLQRLAKLPPETQVYCAHEYTLSNARYAHVAEPDNDDIARRLVAVELMRDRGEPTVPTTIGQELATNPFMRASSAEQFAQRRAAKDAF